jgi:hypothetical protein
MIEVGVSSPAAKLNFKPDAASAANEIKVLRDRVSAIRKSSV